MDPNSFPTKGNLMKAKNSLALSKMGYELMDKKRNILIREVMKLSDEAKDIQSEIDLTFREAYSALQKANIDMGINQVQEIALSVPEEDTLRIRTRSVMGTEIPLVSIKDTPMKPVYSYSDTLESLDIARQKFEKVKALTVKLSTVEISTYRLAANIKKTQKRANALKNITIPRFKELVATIANALEEKDREEFTRLKVIKRQLSEKNA